MSELILEQTRKWIEEVVVGCNFCPFAVKELRAGTIRYQVDNGQESGQLRQAFLEECQWLDKHPETETSLLIFPYALSDFEDYLDFVSVAERLLARHHYESVYQVASFHPGYRFADSSSEDPANYTNRSPYPMLHLLREESMERALERYSDPEKIPQRNIEFARAKGLAYWQQLLATYLKVTGPA